MIFAEDAERVFLIALINNHRTVMNERLCFQIDKKPLQEWESPHILFVSLDTDINWSFEIF
jgi:hypothetical protein